MKVMLSPSILIYFNCNENFAPYNSLFTMENSCVDGKFDHCPLLELNSDLHVFWHYSTDSLHNYYEGEGTGSNNKWVCPG
jgi:hypothetical protein